MAKFHSVQDWPQEGADGLRGKLASPEVNDEMRGKLVCEEDCLRVPQ